MLFSIPIYVEERANLGAQGSSFTVQPLFHAQPIQRAEKLSRALTRLSNELHQLLQNLGQEPRHDLLAKWTFNPLLEEKTVEVRLELESGSYLAQFFLVGFST